MRTRSLLAVGAFAVLVALAGCTGANAADAADGTNRTITVDATGQVDAQPDQAVVRVGVRTRGADAEAARTRLAENVSSLREGLSAAGVDEERITTSGYDIGRDRVRPVEGDRPERRYVARQSFEVTVTDTDAAGSVIDAAIDSGATEVDGVRFTLSEDRRDDLKQRALEAAMDNAERKAGTLAARADLSVTGAASIESVERSGGGYYVEASLAAGDGGGTSIDSGPVTVSAHVVVTYEAA